MAAKRAIKEALQGIKLFNGKLQPTLVKELDERQEEWEGRIQEIFQ